MFLVSPGQQSVIWREITSTRASFRGPGPADQRGRNWRRRHSDRFSQLKLRELANYLPPRAGIFRLFAIQVRSEAGAPLMAPTCSCNETRLACNNNTAANDNLAAAFRLTGGPSEREPAERLRGSRRGELPSRAKSVCLPGDWPVGRLSRGRRGGGAATFNGRRTNRAGSGARRDGQVSHEPPPGQMCPLEAAPLLKTAAGEFAANSKSHPPPPPPKRGHSREEAE